MRETLAGSTWRWLKTISLLSILAVSIGLAIPATGGVALAAGPSPVTMKWRYEFTDQEEVVVAKRGDIARAAQASRSSVGVTTGVSGGRRLATVTVQGEGRVDDLKKMIFNPDGDLKRLVSQPSRLKIKGRGNSGKRLVVKIASNIATGYGWSSDDTARTAFVETQKKKFVQTEPVVGGAGTQEFFLRAVGEGDKSLTLRYQRPWEKASELSGDLDLEVVGELPDTLDLSDPSTAARADALGQSPVPSTSAALSLGAPPATLGTLPASFDWRTGEGLTDVRDQGGCGSCWSFATVGVLEGAIKIRSGATTDLSEQFLVSCNKNNWSCNGGWMAHAYHQSTLGNLQTVAGAVLESDMPYSSANGTCRTITNHPYTIASWQEMSSSPSVAEIKDAIHTYGPVSAAVCVGDTFQSYSGGVFATDETSACSGGVNHAIVLVGWNDNDQTWVLRNSWGPGWGESGYMRIKWGTSRVGAYASYVDYQSACTYSISPTTATVPAAGGTGTVSVTTQTGCPRSASSNVSWITITSGASGTGSGSVGYRVDPNSGSSRIGTLTVAGKSFTITQQASAGCTYAIDPEGVTVAATGGTGSVAVTTQSGCAWSASSSLGWATITSGATGTGNGTLYYTVGANTGADRNGTMFIAGRSFTITQAAPTSCTYTLNSLTNNFAETGGTGSISVNTGDICAWTAASTVDWATITSSNSGTGGGTIGFSVAANTGSARTGTITVGGQVFSFTQQGASQSDIALSNGVPLDQIMTAVTVGGTWQYYYVTLPVGASDLSVEVSNMSGDVDLYVKRGVKPLEYSFDCNSTKSSNTNDSCLFSAPESGLWWIGVRNWATGTLAYTVTATWSTGGSQSDLGDAVDAPGRSWATGGDGHWLSQTVITHDGVDAARSSTISHGQQSWMETSVTGPRTLTFWWKVSSESGYDYLRFAVDGTQVASLSGEQNWAQVSYAIPAGAHALRWSYAKDGTVSSGSDAGWVDQVTLSAPAAGTPAALTVPSSDLDGNYTVSWGPSATANATYLLQEATDAAFTTGLRTSYRGIATSKWITGRSAGATYYYRVQASKSGYSASPWQTGSQGCYIGKAATLAGAVDTRGISWTSDGSTQWSPQTTTTHDGVDAARSGTISHSQQSGMEASVTGPRAMTFWWKVSSESGYDTLRFVVDGTQVTSVSGEKEWAQVSYAIPAGSHVLRWSYAKDGSISSGADAGWVDQVALSAPAAGTPASLTVPSTDVDGKYMISWGPSATAGATYVLQEATDASFTTGLRTPYRGTATSKWITGRSPGATYYYRVQATKSGYAASPWQVGSHGCFIGKAATLGDAVDTSGRSWTSGGTTKWSPQTAITHDGVDAARSGTISHGQQSWLETSVTGPWTLTFWWKVSSESGYDTLRFAVDGIQVAGISGEKEWAQVSHAIPAGTHALRWTYAKDGSISSGTDAGWVDQVTLTFPVIAASDSSLIPPILSWQQLSVGAGHTVAIRGDGTLWAWGANTHGQLGDGSGQDRCAPVRIGKEQRWLSAKAGWLHTLAIDQEGSLWSWGDNRYGQLGDGLGTKGSTSPREVAVGGEWKSVGLGLYHSVAIRGDGSLWAWGDNRYGQLGDGTVESRFAPARIGTEGDWLAVASGLYHTLAIKQDGTLWAWGDNRFGQLGDGTVDNKFVPVRIGKDNDWQAVAAGSYQAVALKSDDTLWAWGGKAAGQLEGAAPALRYTPEMISDRAEWVRVAAGDPQVVAIKGDGTLWSWDGDGAGADQGAAKATLRPVRISRESRWTAVEAGADGRTAAIADDGVIFCWGGNTVEQPGVDTTIIRIDPNQLP